MARKIQSRGGQVRRFVPAIENEPGTAPVAIDWKTPTERQRRAHDYLYGAVLALAKADAARYAEVLLAYHEALVRDCLVAVHNYEDAAGAIVTAEELLARGESDVIAGLAEAIRKDGTLGPEEKKTSSPSGGSSEAATPASSGTTIPALPSGAPEVAVQEG